MEKNNKKTKVEDNQRQGADVHRTKVPQGRNHNHKKSKYEENIQ